VNNEIFRIILEEVYSLCLEFSNISERAEASFFTHILFLFLKVFVKAKAILDSLILSRQGESMK